MNYFFYLLLFFLPCLGAAQSTAFIKELKKEATNKNLDEVKRIAAYNQLTTIYYNRDVSKAKRYCGHALKMAQKDSLSIGMGNVYNNQALLSFGAGEYELAINQVIKAIQVATYLNRPTLKAIAYARLGLIYSSKGYAYKAIEYNIKAINIAKQISNKKSMVLGYYHIGKSYSHLKDTNKAVMYYNKATTYFGAEKDKNLAALIYIEQGLIYMQKNALSKAQQLMMAGLELSKKMHNTRGIAYGNYALGCLANYQQYNNQALEYFSTAQTIYEELDDDLGSAQVLEGMAKVELERGQYKAAEGYLTTALSTARASRAMVLTKDLYQTMFDVYMGGGEYKKAIRYYQKYHLVKDSIFNRDKNREIAEIQIKHKTRELEREHAELAEKHNLTLKLSEESRRNQELKNTQNWYIILALIGGLLLIVIIGLLVFRQDKLKTQIRETELEQRALRSQMNPHFMFNSLNSIQSLIATDNNAEASIYLAKFSRLMRRILQNSRQAYIPLRQEIEFLDNYIELEQRRFKEAFDYELDKNEIEDDHFVMIPPLVIQPFIENAIIHGLLRKSEKGTLKIKFEDYDKSLIKCTIMDNGIGRKAAAAFKTDQSQESLGIKITEQRLKYLTLKEKISVPFIHVIDLEDDKGVALGTQVELLLPIKYKT
ncbi:tetratricopeptide repeat-containing sensor histidine kinase [Aureispira anguillae]|uniref:Histidine kinase n=1 Tax=Aureispira anguillae TaxID=2864201 RepID=A0A915VKL3_9BACT|nr:histidine kinase [Aureispira anguillae]BDS09741.1 histidine kinase [Aureispira anguillae]